MNIQGISQKPSDFLDTAEEMEVFSDYLQQAGNPLWHDWRAAAFIRRQAEDVANLVLLPTGSRFYGTYERNASDWDFYPDGTVDRAAVALLVSLGWRMRHGISAGGNTNLTHEGTPHYEPGRLRPTEYVFSSDNARTISTTRTITFPDRFSLYKMNVNLLCPQSGNEWQEIDAATTYCRQNGPWNRSEAVKIWEQVRNGRYRGLQ